MADEKNENYEEEIEYVDENGNPLEYEEEIPAEEAIEYVDENGNPVEYEEEIPAEQPIEYVDEDGNPVEYEEEAVEYVDEDGNPIEYQEETAAEEGAGADYGTDAMDVLPDGLSAETEETPESEYVSRGEEGGGDEDEDSENDDVDRPKSFFGKLAGISPYEVMILLAFFILLTGVILMLIKWMSYDMIVYPPYRN